MYLQTPSSLFSICLERFNEILLNNNNNNNNNNIVNNNNPSLKKLVDGHIEIDDIQLSLEQRNKRYGHYRNLYDILEKSNSISVHILHQYSLALPLDFITHLDFKSCHDLTNNVIHSISKITTLRSLSFANCKRIDSNGFQSLTYLPKLLVLDVSNTNIDNECLIYVKEMPRIEILNISSVKNITDISFVHLSACTTLTKVIAKSTPLTDDALLFTSNYIKNSHERAGFLSLSSLILSDTLITDRGLPYLLDLPIISHIDLINTKCTEIELENLSNQFSNIQSNNNYNCNSSSSSNSNKNRNNNTIISVNYKSFKIDITRIRGRVEPDLVLENNQQWPIESIRQYLLTLNSCNSILQDLNQSCESIDSDTSGLSSSSSNLSFNLNSSFEIDSSLYLPTFEETAPPKGMLGIKIFKDPFSNSPTKRNAGMIGNINLSLSSPKIINTNNNNQSFSSPFPPLTPTTPYRSQSQPQQSQSPAQTVPSFFTTPIKKRSPEFDTIPTTPIMMTPNGYIYHLLKSPKRTPTLSTPVYSPKSSKKRQNHYQQIYDLLPNNRYPKSPSKNNYNTSPIRPKKLKEDKDVVRNLFNGA